MELRNLWVSLRSAVVFVALATALAAPGRGAQALPFTYPTDAPRFVPVQGTAYAIPAGAYFASPTGLDTGAGTLASPWSLSKALTAGVLPTGATLVLRGGNYRGVNLSISRQITIQAYPHEKPMLLQQDAVGFAASDAALREGAGLASAPTAKGRIPTKKPPRLISAAFGGFLVGFANGESMRGLHGHIWPPSMPLAICRHVVGRPGDWPHLAKDF